MFNLFALARIGANLTPGQRAFLKLVEGFCVAGVVAATPVVASLLSRQGVAWQDVARIAVAAFLTAALLAASKYYKAQGDAPLSQVLTLAAQEAQTLGGAAGAQGKPAPGQVSEAPSAATP